VPVDKLISYAQATLNSSAELQGYISAVLSGGYVAAGVYRHDLTFGLRDGTTRTLAVVQKFTAESELRVLQCVAEVAPSAAFPTLIDWGPVTAGGHAPATHWLITPFYEGTPLPVSGPMPIEIITSLARLHALAGQHTRQIDWLHRVDTGFFRRTFENALASLDGPAQRHGPDAAGYAEARRRLTWAASQAVLYETLEGLPMTLTHGDVHGGNIIQDQRGRAVLIDWGNARVAPAMLDVANMVQLDSKEWQVYLAARQVDGAALDEHTARAEYCWATAMVNLQYLPWVVEHTPVQGAQTMVGRVAWAVEQL